MPEIEENSSREILSVADYIDELSKVCSPHEVYVYRGESQIFGTSMPGLFRKKYLDKNEYFERNILDKVISDGIDTHLISHLHTAIEAQHGGFPSRLLDVTFNALIALNFAVTPHFTERVNSRDGFDGRVIIIKSQDFVSASSKELIDFFEEELLNPNSIYNQLPIFFNMHYIIDHYKKNRRIDIQQGAFIMFVGKEYRPLANGLINEIIIPSSSKEKIRNELDQFFGINNSFIYPVPDNYASNIDRVLDKYSSEYSKNLESQIETLKDNINQELNSIFYKYQQETDFTKKESIRFELIKFVESVSLDCEISLERLSMNLIRNMDCRVLTELEEKIKSLLLMVKKFSQEKLEQRKG